VKEIVEAQYEEAEKKKNEWVTKKVNKGLSPTKGGGRTR